MDCVSFSYFPPALFSRTIVFGAYATPNESSGLTDNTRATIIAAPPSTNNKATQVPAVP